MVTVAVNGFGRIGRSFLRAVFSDVQALKKINVVALNIGPARSEFVAHSFKYDSSMGTFPGSVGLPRSHIDAVLAKPPAQRKLWMPDLSQPEAASNFDELADWERSAIREQLYAYLQHKITFIGYTGITNARLLDIALRHPDFFDNKVIIIDEVHNLTRLMAGKLEPFLTMGARLKAKVAGGKASEFNVAASKFEPVTPGTWKPKHGAGGKYYSRAYLFYRLLCQAKNSKIIALSGTPIVNRAVSLVF